jgi:hypothetical protein
MQRTSRIQSSAIVLVAVLAVAAQGCGGEPVAELDPGAEAPGATTQEQSGAVPIVEHVSLEPDSPLPGDLVHARVRVSGPGPHRLHYSWTLGGRAFEDQTGVAEIPKLRKGERVAVSVVASNRDGKSEAVLEEVRVGNSAPSLVDLRVDERAGYEGEPDFVWAAEARAVDTDGDGLSYEYNWLVDGRSSKHEASVFPVDELRRGQTVRVKARASDGDDWSEWAESGTITIENAAPEITSTPPRLDQEGVFHYAIEVQDPDGDRSMRYELARGPRGMKLDRSTGELHWKPEIDQAGVHAVELVVDDRHGGRAEQSFRLPIVVRSTDEENGRDARDRKSGRSVPAATP